MSKDARGSRIVFLFSAFQIVDDSHVVELALHRMDGDRVRDVDGGVGVGGPVRGHHASEERSAETGAVLQCAQILFLLLVLEEFVQLFACLLGVSFAERLCRETTQEFQLRLSEVQGLAFLRIGRVLAIQPFEERALHRFSDRIRCGLSFEGVRHDPIFDRALGSYSHGDFEVLQRPRVGAGCVEPVRTGEPPMPFQRLGRHPPARAPAEGQSLAEARIISVQQCPG